MTAYITRTKIYPSPGRNYRVAWKYSYDVEGLLVTLGGFDSIVIARKMAKKYGATTIVETWKVEDILKSWRKK